MDNILSAQRRSPKSLYVLIPLLLTVLFFFTTHRAYHLPFSYGDDHRALGLLHPEKVSDTYKAAMYGQVPDLKGSLAVDLYFGRFRPLSWSWYAMLCKLFGDNVFLYRINNLLILFLSCFFLYRIFSCFGVDDFSAFIVLAVYVFGRNSEAWWTLDPPSQNPGECVLLAGMYTWLLYRKKQKTGWYILPSFLFLLATLDKESYIVCIPVILLTDYFFFNPKPRLFAKEYWLPMLTVIIPLAGLVFTVLYVKKVYAYAYTDTVLGIFIYNVGQFIMSAGLLAAPIVLLFKDSRNISRSIVLRIVVVLFLWAILQLVLLKGIKLDSQHHYLIPWLIYPFILTAIALTKLRAISTKWYRLNAIFYLLVVMLFAKNTYANSQSYSASLEGYYKMIDAIKKDPGPEIIYLTSDACTDDWIAGTRVILDNEGINQEMYFCSTADSVPSWEKEYAANSTQNAYKHIPFNASIFKPDGRWIILVDDMAKNGVVSEDISFYKDGQNEYIKVKGKSILIPGHYYYFSESYPGRSIGDILRGDFRPVNYKGFYAIKLNDLLKVPPLNNNPPPPGFRNLPKDYE